MIGGKTAVAAKRTPSTKRIVTDEKRKTSTAKKESKCAANVSPTLPSPATKTTPPISMNATVVVSTKPHPKSTLANTKSVPAKRSSSKQKLSIASSVSLPSPEQKRREEKEEKHSNGSLTGGNTTTNTTITTNTNTTTTTTTTNRNNVAEIPIVEDLERTENAGSFFPVPPHTRQPQKKISPHLPKQPRESKLRDQIQQLPSISDAGGTTAVPVRGVDIPIVEDLEKADHLVPLLPLPVRGAQRPSSIAGRGKPRSRSGNSLQRSESAGPMGWKSNSSSCSCCSNRSNSNNNSIASYSKKFTNGRQKSVSTAASYHDVDVGDVIIDEEDDDDDEDEYEISSDYDDDDEEDDDDAEDDDDEEEEEEDEEVDEDDDDDYTEEEEDEDENDRKSRSRRTRRVMEQITVKVSREGDRNVKVMFITQSTKFKAFVKEIMRRFSYSHVRDFDMYCIDAAGDHVDIDVPQDFKNLVRNFLQSLQQERSKNSGGIFPQSPPPSTTNTTTTQGSSESDGKDGKRRFSARETLLGSASLLRSGSPMYVSPLLNDDVDRSSSTVLRLYVRDSYRTRQQEEKMRMQYSLVHSDASGGQMPLQYPSTPTPPALPRIHQSLIPPDLTSVDNGSVGPSEMLMRDCSTISAQFNHTVCGLAQTIGFREDEEVQWSRMCLLGKGSSGAVYEGITSEGKIMAVKVQEIPLDEDAEEVKVIQREINLMRSLKHKNIVAYYGCQTKILPSGARELEIFLEHCHGGSLSHLRRKFERAKERFSISLVRTYARQILEGLNYLHSMNVVHRDLKSDNVLISALGEAKLADFGCSKRIGTATLQQDSCADRGAGYQTMVGTPLFMAPEVLNGTDEGSSSNSNNNNNNNDNNSNNNGNENDNANSNGTNNNNNNNNHGYGKPADIWAVGCLVLELLGRQPWAVKGNANAFQIMYHISKSTSMPTGVPEKCPRSLYNFFVKCFERNPRQRATAEELLQHEWITCPDNQLEEVLPEEEASPSP